MSMDIFADCEGFKHRSPEVGVDADAGRPEGLGEYVRRIMRDRRLTIREVQKRSGDRIGQSYIGLIAQGTYTNLTVEKVKALANGLGVDEDEIFEVARGRGGVDRVKHNGSYELLMALDVIRQLAATPNGIEIVRDFLSLPLEERQGVEKLINNLKRKDVPFPERT